MGQQQLLLIVLGVIIVGIAVVVGINVFTASSSQANRDAVIADLTNLASLAQQYYRKPTALGGGGNAFTGWTIPGSIDTTGNGTYATTTVSATQVVIVGTGNELGTNGTGNVQATMTVTASDISTAINN
jgi:Tfp pilus assembly protein PilE